MCIFEWLKSNAIFVISIAGFVTAASSLLVSILSFRRDYGRLDVSIGQWNVFNMATSEYTGESYIRISAVNSGRRPIVIDSIGGFPNFWRLRKLLNQLLPNYFDIVGFFIADPVVNKQMIDEKGEYKTLLEGQKITVSIPIKKDDIKTALKSWDDFAVFYIADSTGKCHFVKQRVLKKFKKDIKEFFKK